jgi:phospholipase/carboxylesterase
MSDGGTFTLASGVGTGSPFTHLAPVAASFHPMLLGLADLDRLAGLPVRLTHGALDWMFPVGMARTAQRVLASAGAAVEYREVADLSHAWPNDEQAGILDWFLGSPAAPAPA